MTVEIRRATPDEAPIIRELLHRAYAENAAAGFNFMAADVGLEKVVDTFGYADIFLLSEDGEPRGTVTVFNDGNIGWFGVAPEKRGLGYGRRLLAFAEERVRARGQDRAYLNTPVSHPWLPAFYRRCGFIPVRVVHYPGKKYDSEEFEKPLPPRPADGER
ncbi:MAG: GNAT family N-acetyltransferase [Bacillota bacterium]